MITRDEIRLYKAQDNTDNDNGGGSMTGVEVVDGEINNLFPDISRIDTVNGDVSMRKMFPAVITENTDIYYGAHSIVRKNPDDARVSVVLAHTDDPHDTRIQAQQRVESYMSLSYEAIFYLYGNHIQGMKALTFLSRPENDSPEIGEVYVLTNGTHTQYVRVQAVDDTEVLLSFSNGGSFTDYKRKLSVVTITQALEYDFSGSSFSPAGNLSDVHTYHTAIANATKFYGTKTLAEDFTTSQTALVVDSIHQQLVPSTLQQTPMVNKQGTPDLNVLITASNLDDFSNVLPSYAYKVTSAAQLIVMNSGNNYSAELNIGMPIEPGSLSSIYGTVDDGSGFLTGTSYGITGRVDYLNGIIYLKSTQSINTTKSVSFKPATSITVPAKFTSFIDITTLNNSLVFVKNVSPPPSPASLRIDYRSGGKWYRIESSGLLALGDDASIGIGAIAYNGDGTATVSVTLGAEPDVSSKIIYTWASAWGYNSIAGPYDANMAYIIQLPAAENINKISIKFGTPNGVQTSVWNGVGFDPATYGSVDAYFDAITNQIIINSFYSTHFGYNYVPPEIHYDYETEAAASAEYTPQSVTSIPDGSGILTVNVGAATTAGNFYISYPIVMDYRGSSITVTVMVNQAGQIFSMNRGSEINPSYMSLKEIFNTHTPQLSNFTVNTGAGTVVFHPTEGLQGLVEQFTQTRAPHEDWGSVTRSGGSLIISGV